MKTQSYYRCGNCALITARDAGQILTSCPNCGNGALKILVPVDGDTKEDPLSRRKKTALTMLIGLAGFAAVAVFLLFGRLLQGYMTFESGREATERAQERLSADMQVQEASFSSLTRRIAEAEERKATLAEVEARFVVLTNQTSLAEAKRDLLLEALTTSHLELASVTGTVAGLNVEIAALKSQRNELTEHVDRKKEEIDKQEEDEKKYAERKRQSEASTAASKAALEELQRVLQDTRITLSSENTKVVGVRSTLAGLENDQNRLRKKVEALTAEDARLMAAVDAGISLTNRLTIIVQYAETSKATAVAELVKAQASLDAVNSARDKTREEADAQSVRVASLAARKEALETNIRDMEITEAELVSVVLEIKKQLAAAIPEAAKAQATLDALSMARDQAREEADAQSARAAALKVEVIALEKAKADVEKVKGVPEK